MPKRNPSFVPHPQTKVTFLKEVLSKWLTDIEHKANQITRKVLQGNY